MPGSFGGGLVHDACALASGAAASLGGIGPPRLARRRTDSPSSSFTRPSWGSRAGGAGHLDDRLLLGVTLPFLRELCAKHSIGPDARTHEVAAIVRGVTAGSGLALAELELLRQEQREAEWARSQASAHASADADAVLDDAAAAASAKVASARRAPTARPRKVVSRAGLFVSHAQCCGFVKMLDAVEAHCELHKLAVEETYLWIDMDAIRQHRGC
jgi:hypothetical protein